MRFRPFAVLALICGLAVSLAAPAGASAAPDQARFGAGEVRDKIAGAWLGAVIGGAWGRPTEFHYRGRIVPADRVPRWSTRYANHYAYRGESDEDYVEIPFLDATLRGGPDTGWPQWGSALAGSDFELFFANKRARENLRAGIPPPLSGDPAHNPFADDIDFQIESDWIGLAAPGQPGAAIDTAWRLGHVTNYGDGVYGGVMVAAMHAAAFRAASVGEIVEAGREAVPRGSAYRAMIEDVLRWHAHHPRDWQAVWRRLERRWNAHSPAVKHTATDSEFNVDAKLNGGYILLGLLYGRGEIGHTIRVAMRAGQDSDCNPSAAASILGTWLGRKRIPARFRNGIAYDRRFPHTGYTLREAIAANLRVAEQLTVARGGSVAGEWSLAPSPLLPPPLEQWPAA
jgi:hypothetical protein